MVFISTFGLIKSLKGFNTKFHRIASGEIDIKKITSLKDLNTISFHKVLIIKNYLTLKFVQVLQTCEALGNVCHRFRPVAIGVNSLQGF